MCRAKGVKEGIKVLSRVWRRQGLNTWLVKSSDVEKGVVYEDMKKVPTNVTCNQRIAFTRFERDQKERVWVRQEPGVGVGDCPHSQHDSVQCVAPPNSEGCSVSGYLGDYHDAEEGLDASILLK